MCLLQQSFSILGGQEDLAKASQEKPRGENPCSSVKSIPHQVQQAWEWAATTDPHQPGRVSDDKKLGKWDCIYISEENMKGTCMCPNLHSTQKELPHQRAFNKFEGQKQTLQHFLYCEN